MKVSLRKVVLRFILIVVIIFLLLVGWRLYRFFSHTSSNNSTNSQILASHQAFDYPVYYNTQTGSYEKMEPLPEAEPIGEEYLQTRVEEMIKPVGRESLLTPSNNSKQDWLIIDDDSEGKIKRLTVSCGALMGVSELAPRGPVFIQVDIQVDGEWVFGIKQELDAYKGCQFILPQRSPFRCYLWKPEGSDWVCEYSYTSRWW